MAQLIAYAWIATVLLTIGVAVRKGIPILHAFGWIDTRPGLYQAVLVLGVSAILATLQLATDVRPLGEEPIIWAGLLILLHVWTCIAWRLRHA